MTLHRLLYVWMGIIVGYTAIAPSSASAVLIDQVAAVVGDEVITQSELDLVLARERGDTKAPYTGPLLRRMIEKKVILQTARRFRMEVTGPEFERVLAEQESRFPSRAAFRAAVTTSFPTWEDYLDTLKIEVTMAKLLQGEAADANLRVTEEEAKAHYNRYPERFQQADQIALEQILFAPSDSDMETVRGIADTARAEIASGASFDQIAERYKTPVTSLGRFKKGELLPEVERFVVGSNIGEISPVIQTPAGFHLFRVTEHIQGAPQSFEAARPAILTLLLNEKRNAFTRQWFNGLLKQTFIEIK